jgi:hypothetical protein
MSGFKNVVGLTHHIRMAGGKYTNNFLTFKEEKVYSVVLFICLGYKNT